MLKLKKGRSGCNEKVSSAFLSGGECNRVDLTVRVCGLTFKNPILPAASELVFDEESAKRVADSGMGGIFSGNDALQYLLCGCSLIEIGTAAYMEGLGVFKRIEQEILSWMKKTLYVHFGFQRQRPPEDRFLVTA